MHMHVYQYFLASLSPPLHSIIIVCTYMHGYIIIGGALKLYMTVYI